MGENINTTGCSNITFTYLGTHIIKLKYNKNFADLKNCPVLSYTNKLNSIVKVCHLGFEFQQNMLNFLVSTYLYKYMNINICITWQSSFHKHSIVMIQVLSYLGFDVPKIQQEKRSILVKKFLDPLGWTNIVPTFLACLMIFQTSKTFVTNYQI